MNDKKETIKQLLERIGELATENARLHDKCAELEQQLIECMKIINDRQ